MSAVRNTFAAVPLAVALFGNAAVDSGTDPDGRRFRVPPTASPDLAASALITDEQQEWLDEHNPFGIPTTAVPGNRTLVVRQGYTLAHNNVDLIADWVSYRLTPAYVNGPEERPGSSAFKPDPALPAGRRSELTDYQGWKNILDRGHQVASADSKGRGKRVIRESFLLSNMTPQTSRLNQAGWRLLEERIQRLAAHRSELWVITGPLFVDEDQDGLVEFSVIGDNEVAVPTHYFKIVVAKTGAGEIDSMAFIIPNEEMAEPFDAYLRTIDEVEQLSGFDFLSGLSDSIERAAEARQADDVWEVPAT